MLDQLLGMFQDRAAAFGGELLRWVSSVQRNALVKWAPVFVARLDCACYRHGAQGVVIRCPKQALASCLVCRETVCLEHAVIAPNADVCCVRCMDAMAARSLEEQSQGAPPPFFKHAPGPAPGTVHEEPLDPVRAQALRTLGLAPGASLDEINQAFRKAAMKHHPDKHPPARRAQAEARYKKISEAYEFLKRHGAGKAAA